MSAAMIRMMMIQMAMPMNVSDRGGDQLRGTAGALALALCHFS